MESVFEEEVEKFTKFHQISLMSIFRAPQVISHDKINNTIHFEYIENLTSIRNAYILFLKQGNPEKREKILSIFRDCGKALAQIHQKLSLSTNHAWKLEKKYRNIFRLFLTTEEISELGNTPQAFLHSDFGFSNILLQKNSDTLVIIDCSPNSHTTFFCYGSVYIDLANFLACLDGLVRVSLKQYCCFHWSHRWLLKEAFLEGYQKQSSQTLNYTLLTKITKATAMCYFRKKYGCLKALAAYSLLYFPEGIAELLKAIIQQWGNGFKTFFFKAD